MNTKSQPYSNSFPATPIVRVTFVWNSTEYSCNPSADIFSGRLSFPVSNNACLTSIMRGVGIYVASEILCDTIEEHELAFAAASNDGPQRIFQIPFIY